MQTTQQTPSHKTALSSSEIDRLVRFAHRTDAGRQNIDPFDYTPPARKRRATRH